MTLAHWFGIWVCHLVKVKEKATLEKATSVCQNGTMHIIWINPFHRWLYLFKLIDQIGWLCNNLWNGFSQCIRSRHITFSPPSSGIEDNPTIFYQLIRGSTDQTNKYDTFYLQQRQDNGWTYADVKVNQPLDFERIKEYNLTIRVEVSFLSQNLSVFVLPPHLIFLQFPEQWSSTACQRSHHLHRAGGRQRRDSPLHRERARDCDGGRAGWDPSHQVGLLFQMVAIEGGGLTRWQCRIVSHSSSLSTLKKATHPTCCLSPHLHYNHHRLGHRHRYSPLWHILSFPL